jgi:hypothetical protein
MNRRTSIEQGKVLDTSKKSIGEIQTARRSGLGGVVTETGIDVQETSAEVVGVGNGILTVDFVCFDVEHSSVARCGVCNSSSYLVR